MVPCVTFFPLIIQALVDKVLMFTLAVQPHDRPSAQALHDALFKTTESVQKDAAKNCNGGSNLANAKIKIERCRREKRREKVASVEDML